MSVCAILVSLPCLVHLLVFPLSTPSFSSNYTKQRKRVMRLCGMHTHTHWHSARACLCVFRCVASLALCACAALMELELRWCCNYCCCLIEWRSPCVFCWIVFRHPFGFWLLFNQIHDSIAAIIHTNPGCRTFLFESISFGKKRVSTRGAGYVCVYSLNSDSGCMVYFAISRRFSCR